MLKSALRPANNRRRPVRTALASPIRSATPANASQNVPRKVLSRSYSGAKMNPQDPWYVHEMLVNQLISSASPRLRMRVRDLVRNYPVFTRAVSGYAAFMIGQGPKFKSLALDKNGEADEKLRKKIESSFSAWMEKHADIAGTSHFYEIQSLVCRQLIESGEAFIKFHLDKSRLRKGQNPLSLMSLESDRIYTSNISTYGTSEIESAHGLEYNRKTGEVYAYYVQDDELGYETTRVPAANMVHVFEKSRPGQLRGVTPLAPAIVFARSMSQYAGSELDAQRLASRYLSFITSPDIQGFQNMRGMGKPSNSSEDDNKIDYIENALIEYLRPGEEIKFADMPNRPGDGFGQFESYTTRMVGLCVNLSYEVLSGDYQRLNYSTSKAVRGDNALFLAPDRLRIEQRSLKRCFREWLKYEALAKDYIPSYYFANPDLIENHAWFYNERVSVDPLRDATADIKLLDAGIKSPQEVISARGGDAERVISEVAAFQQMLLEKGVVLKNAISTPLASNPSNLGAKELN